MASMRLGAASTVLGRSEFVLLHGHKGVWELRAVYSCSVSKSNVCVAEQFMRLYAPSAAMIQLSFGLSFGDFIGIPKSITWNPTTLLCDLEKFLALL